MIATHNEGRRRLLFRGRCDSMQRLAASAHRSRKGRPRDAVSRDSIGRIGVQRGARAVRGGAVTGEGVVPADEDDAQFRGRLVQAHPPAIRSILG